MMHIINYLVRAAPGGLGQPKRKLHDGRYSRERCERQPARLRPSHLRDTDHRGG
jgi:hypothetical protein